MILHVYVLRDVVEGQATLLLTAPSQSVLKRNVKEIMSTKEKSPFNTYIEDKSLFHVADYDSETLEMKGIHPCLVFSLVELRDEILEEIKRAKALKEEVDGTSETSN